MRECGILQQANRPTGQQANSQQVIGTGPERAYTTVVSHWPARLTSELNASDDRARALAAPLSSLQLNWKPSPSSWSIGQCLEHLAIATEVYLPRIATALDRAPAGRVDEIRSGAPSRWFIRSFIAPSTIKAKAPGKIAPGSNVDAAILVRYLAAHRAARELVARAAGYDVNRIRFANPFVPLLRFTVGTGLEIISKHAMRHLQQAERVRNHPDFPWP